MPSERLIFASHKRANHNQSAIQGKIMPSLVTKIMNVLSVVLDMLIILDTIHLSSLIQ